MKPIPSFLLTSLARSDLSRVTNELYTLQRQTASNNKADDLKGYGNEAGRIISTRTAIAQSTARVDAANKLVARFDIQDTALGLAASAAAQLKQDIFTALSSDNGTFLSGQLETAFQQVTQALNTTYEGTPLFTGERRDGAAVRATNLGDLPSALSSGSLFEESARPQTVDLGVGAPVVVAEKASEIARGIYNVFKNLYDLTSTNTLGNPITADERAALLAVADSIDTAHQDIVDAQGRNGDAQSRVEREVTRLTARADLLTKHLGQVAEVDLAEVAVKLSAAQTQYQATAKVFSQLKDLSLVNFLD